jgi:hypothetical protein
LGITPGQFDIATSGWSAPAPAYESPLPTYQAYEEPAYEPPAPTYESPLPAPSPQPVYEDLPYVGPVYQQPVYEPPAPAYEPPTYESPLPVYEPPAPAYVAPEPVYEPPVYEQPVPVPPAPVYEPPVPAYVAPEPVTAPTYSQQDVTAAVGNYLQQGYTPEQLADVALSQGITQEQFDTAVSNYTAPTTSALDQVVAPAPAAGALPKSAEGPQDTWGKEYEAQEIGDGTYTASQIPNVQLPPGFNWQEYVNQNPDLKQAGIDTQAEAERHYKLYGHKETRAGAPDMSVQDAITFARSNLNNQNAFIDAGEAGLVPNAIQVGKYSIAPVGYGQIQGFDIGGMTGTTSEASQLAPAGTPFEQIIRTDASGNVIGQQLKLKTGSDSGFYIDLDAQGRITAVDKFDESEWWRKPVGLAATFLGATLGAPGIGQALGFGTGTLGTIAGGAALGGLGGIASGAEGANLLRSMALGGIGAAGGQLATQAGSAVQSAVGPGLAGEVLGGAARGLVQAAPTAIATGDTSNLGVAALVGGLSAGAQSALKDVGFTPNQIRGASNLALQAFSDRPNINSIINSVGDLIGSPNAAVAAKSAVLFNLAQSGADPMQIIGAAQDLYGSIERASVPSGLNDAATAAFLAAKRTGATDEEAAAAAQAVSGGTVAGISRLPGTAPTTSTQVTGGDLTPVGALDLDTEDITSLELPKAPTQEELTASVASGINNAATFDDAFASARAVYGPGKTFTWQGKEYSTDTRAENPTLAAASDAARQAAVGAGAGRGTMAGMTAEEAANLLNVPLRSETAPIDTTQTDFSAAATGMEGAPVDSLTTGFTPDKTATKPPVQTSEPAVDLQAAAQQMITGEGGVPTVQEIEAVAPPKPDQTFVATGKRFNDMDRYLDYIDRFVPTDSAGNKIAPPTFEEWQSMGGRTRPAEVAQIAGDVAKNVAIGAAALAQSPFVFADLIAGRSTSGAREELSSYISSVMQSLSPEFKANQEEMNKLLGADPSLWETAKAYGLNPQQLLGFVAQTSPTMLAGGAAGLGIRLIGGGIAASEAAAIIANAGVHGAQSAVNVMDQARQMGYSDAQVLEMARGTAGLTGIISAAAQKFVPGAMSLESKLIGSTQGAIKGALTRYGGELGSEEIEEGSAKIIGNMMVGRPWNEGLSRTMVEAAVASGALMAGADAAYSLPQVETSTPSGAAATTPVITDKGGQVSTLNDVLGTPAPTTTVTGSAFDLGGLDSTKIINDYVATVLGGGDASQTASTSVGDIITNAATTGADVSEATTNAVSNIITAAASTGADVASVTSSSVSGAVSAAVTSGADVAAVTQGAVSSAVTSAVTSGLDTTSAVTSAVGGAVTSAVNSGADVASTVTSAVNSAVTSAATSGADVTTAVNSAVGSAVTSAVTNGSDATAAVTSAVNSSVSSAVTSAASTGADVTSTITASVDASVGSAVTSAVTSGADATTAVTDAVASSVTSAVTSAASSGSDVTAAVAASVDASVTSAITAAADSGADVVQSVAPAVSASVTSAVTAAVESGADTSAAVTSSVASAVNSAVTSAVDSGADVTAAVTSAVSTAVDSAVTSAVNTGTDVSTAVSTAVSSAVDSAVTSAVNSGSDVNTAINTSVSTAVDSAVNVATNTGTDVNVAVSSAVTSSVESAVNAATDAGTDVSTAITTSVAAAVSTAVNSGVSTETAVNAAVDAVVNVGVNTSTAIDLVNEVVKTLPPKGEEKPVVTTPEPEVTPPEPKVTPPTTTPTTTTTTTTKPATPKVSTPSGASMAAALPAFFGGGQEMSRLAPQMLEAKVTQGYVDPLARLRQAQEQFERDAMIQNLDPRLMQILSERMGAPQGGLGQAANEQPYYSYGQEDSIDDILGGSLPEAVNYAKGGYVEPLQVKEGGMALPILAKEGGLPTHKGRENFKDGKHVAGEGDGQSDDIPAWLADGEFVFPADVVSALGNGSTKAGTDKLYEMMHGIRERARSKGPKDLPPPALKSPLDYLKSKR